MKHKKVIQIITPRIPNTQSFATKKCAQCGIISSIEDFAFTYSIFYPDHHIPICNDCAESFLREHYYEWEWIDKLCQWSGIPFIVKEWTRLFEMNDGVNTWAIYSKVFKDSCYQSLGWKDYNDQYVKLREVGLIEDEIPLVREQKYIDLRREWGGNYTDEDLIYLDDLYKGLRATQNVNGALQIDQAKKICKLSLEIDSRIRAGDKEVDKFLSSYDKLVKTAEFTPKNTKNAVDFDSFAEIGYWLEKRGRQNKFYDGATRDIIDDTLKNIENYTQRLYINEGGIGDEITQRLAAIKQAANSVEDNIYNLPQNFDEDKYDNEGFTLEEEQEEFIATEDGDYGRTY